MAITVSPCLQKVMAPQYLLLSREGTATYVPQWGSKLLVMHMPKDLMTSP